MKEFKLTKKLKADKHTVFDYFTKPDFLKMWAAPEGMTLQIPEFEAKAGGRYVFNHSSDKGIYTCTGYFKEFLPDQKLVQIETVRDPSGKVIFDNSECMTEFKSVGNETEIQIFQNALNDENIGECELGWKQSFDKLERLLTSKKRLDKGEQYFGNQTV